MNKLNKIPSLFSYLIWRWRAIGQIDKLWTSKNYIDLINLCDVLINKGRPDHLAFYYRGLSNEALNIYDNAIRDLEQSEQVLNNYKRKHLFKDYFTLIPIQMSRVYRKMQDTRKAFEYADKSVHADNGDVKGLKYRASLKEDFGDYIGALEDLNEALKRRPRDKHILKMRDGLTYKVIEDKKTASR